MKIKSSGDIPDRNVTPTTKKFDLIWNRRTTVWIYSEENVSDSFHLYRI